MSEGVEGVDEAIEGTLSGRAVESLRGSASADGEPSGPEECANCGAQVMSAFCPQCGQAKHLHRSLSAIFHDLSHGVLHLDGKFWLTLPLLVFKPGKLTRRYIDGERAKFVSPVAMFLFSVFAMFAVFQMIGLTTPADLNPDETNDIVRDQSEEAVADLRAQLESMPADDPLRAEREADLDDLENLIGADQFDLNDSAAFMIKASGIDEIVKELSKKWRENPTLVLYKLQATGYKFSWLLIPLSIPSVWLLLAWRREFKAYDHAVFVTYSLAFMSLLFITISLVNAAGLSAGWTFFVFAAVAPLHIYKHLKGAYRLSRFSSIWRFFALFFFIIAVLFLFLQALLLIGAL